MGREGVEEKGKRVYRRKKLKGRKKGKKEKERVC